MWVVFVIIHIKLSLLKNVFVQRDIVSLAVKCSRDVGWLTCKTAPRVREQRLSSEIHKPGTLCH